MSNSDLNFATKKPMVWARPIPQTVWSALDSLARGISFGTARESTTDVVLTPADMNAAVRFDYQGGNNVTLSLTLPVTGGFEVRPGSEVIVKYKDPGSNAQLSLVTTDGTLIDGIAPPVTFEPDRGTYGTYRLVWTGQQAFGGIDWIIG